jgi:hypothetical protein
MDLGVSQNAKILLIRRGNNSLSRRTPIHRINYVLSYLVISLLFSNSNSILVFYHARLTVGRTMAMGTSHIHALFQRVLYCCWPDRVGGHSDQTTAWKTEESWFDSQMRKEIFSSPERLWTPPPYYPRLPVNLSPGIKRPKCTADRSPPTSTEAKNKWNYTSAPLKCPCSMPKDDLTYTVYANRTLPKELKLQPNAVEIKLSHPVT